MPQVIPLAISFLLGVVIGATLPLTLGRGWHGHSVKQWIRARWSKAKPVVTSVGQLVSRLRSLVWAVLAGVALAALPTYYSLFPPQSGNADALRVFLFLLWLAVAGLAVYLTATREEHVRAFIEAQERVLSSRVRDAERIVLEELLRPGTRGTPDDFYWRIFLYDDRQDLLLPFFPESDLPVLRFKPGQGAVGEAFSAGKPRGFFDKAVSDASLGLTTEQQTRFADFQTVVAAPIKVQNKTIAVLSAIARPHDEYFQSDAGGAILGQLVQTVEGVLVTMGH